MRVRSLPQRRHVFVRSLYFCNFLQLYVFRDQEGSFQCLCREFFSGERCENIVERIDCSPSLCSGKGTCQQTNEPPFFRCICEHGTSGQGQWQYSKRAWMIWNRLIFFLLITLKDCSQIVGCLLHFSGEVVAPLTVISYECSAGKAVNSTCNANGEWSTPLICQEK